MKKIRSNAEIDNKLLDMWVSIDKQVLKNIKKKTYSNLWNSQINSFAPFKQEGYVINICVEKSFFYGKNK